MSHDPRTITKKILESFDAVDEMVDEDAGTVEWTRLDAENKMMWNYIQKDGRIVRRTINQYPE